MCTASSPNTLAKAWGLALTAGVATPLMIWPEARREIANDEPIVETAAPARHTRVIVRLLWPPVGLPLAGMPRRDARGHGGKRRPYSPARFIILNSAVG